MMPPLQELYVRVSVLLVYITAAAWAAWTHAHTAWFVLHATGAFGAVCAASLAVTYAGLIGEATPGAGVDQARDYMESEDWDD